ncbi:MAG: hypothetical protein ACJAYA_001375 [Bacteroidia bacterium]
MIQSHCLLCKGENGHKDCYEKGYKLLH